ncbi:MAG: AAA family ATPase [Gammaproteobacteria bacterium]
MLSTDMNSTSIANHELEPRSSITGSPVVLNYRDLLAHSFRPSETLLSPWLISQSLSMVHAWRGVGKTHFALGVAYAVASGGSFLRWTAAVPRRTLYIDGEMPGARIQERIAAIVAGTDRQPPSPDFLQFITPDTQDGPIPDISTRRGQDAIDRIVHDETALIVVDNLSSLARSGGAENESESWLPVADWALRQRTHGRSVLFIHHSGKGGQQRGTSKKEDLLDTVIALKHPEGYTPEMGADFTVKFEKSRHLFGRDTAGFEARLITDKQGRQAWEVEELTESNYDRVVKLANDGHSQAAIVKQLKIHKSNVSRAWTKAIANGDITPEAIKSAS